MYLLKKSAKAAGAAAGQRADPARSHRRGGAAARRTGTSRPTSGASLRSPSCGATACRPSARDRLGGKAASWVEKCLARPERPGHRGERLRERARRSHPALCAGEVRGAGHRRLRPQRHARRAARFFEVDAKSIAVAALAALDSPLAADARRRYGYRRRWAVRRSLAAVAAFAGGSSFAGWSIGGSAIAFPRHSLPLVGQQLAARSPDRR